MIQFSSRITAALAAACVLAAGTGTALADKYAGEFMAVGGGARALGMGGAFTAVADDASAVFWNPAGLSGMEKRQALFMHSERFGDLVNYNFASFVSPTSSFVSADREAAFGVALIHQGVDDIIIVDDSNTQLIDQDGDGIFEPEDGDRLIYNAAALPRESMNDFALLGSFAMKTSIGRVAGTLKILYTNAIAGYSSTGIGLDVGFLRKDLLPRFDVGVKLQDITGTFIGWSSGTNEFIAPSVRLGTAYRIDSDQLNGSVLFALDGVFYFEDRRWGSQFWVDRFSTDIYGGVELRFQEKVMVRGGFSEGNPTLGAGFRLGFLGFDYAYLHYPDDDSGVQLLEDSHRVSLQAEF